MPGLDHQVPHGLLEGLMRSRVAFRNASAIGSGFVILVGTMKSNASFTQ